MGKKVNWDCHYWRNLGLLYRFLLRLSMEKVQIEKAKRTIIKKKKLRNTRPFKQFK